MAARVLIRPISDEKGMRLPRIVRRGSGSVVTWRRAQMVLLSAQAMDVSEIARVTFTSEDRVRDVLHNFNLDGFDSLYPRYAGGRPPTFTLAQRREVKKVALSRPVDHYLPFSTWSLLYLRTLYPPEVRIGLVLDNFSPHLSTRDDPRTGRWAVANNAELAYTPTNASWLNRIEAQFQALRYFALDGPTISATPSRPA